MQNKNFQHSDDISLSDVNESVDTTAANRPSWKRILSFFGPAYLVSVGYMDPGNWATDLAGGAQFGYKLIWVLLMSNLMALLLQSLSARLGIVRRRDLAQANRDTYPKHVNFALYILAEIGIAAMDLAEVLGMAIGLQLLTGMPLIWGVSITVLDTFLLLLLQRLGMRKMEAFIVALVLIIGLSFLIQIILAKPDVGDIMVGFVPTMPSSAALYIAIGIIGATIMPHNLYLHSALVQTRKIKRTPEGIKKALRLNFFDTAIALNLAFFVNAGILVLAGALFYTAGRTDVAEIKQAHQLLAPLLGTKVAPILFAIALIAAGQSSTVTGTMAGQIVMEGYLRLRITPWIRRLLTRLIAIIPAIIVILINGEDNIDSLLILSQVILSMQLAFAIIPLIHFVSNKKEMGEFAIKPWTKILAWLITFILVFLNIQMVTNEAITFFTESDNIFWEIIIILGGIAFVTLLLISFFYPILKSSKNKGDSALVHGDIVPLQDIVVPTYKKIAAALDFSTNDSLLLSHALAQGVPGSEYLLMHIVESANASYFKTESDDAETIKDKERLQTYVLQLEQKGIKARACIGYGGRAKELGEIINTEKADLLVIGAHGHAGFKDLLFGETINSVRHAINIPVFVVKV